MLDVNAEQPDARDGLGRARRRDAVAEPAPSSRPHPKQLARRWARQGVEALAQRPRVWKYRVLSTCPNVRGGAPVVNQPVLFVGPGIVELGERVQFGWRRSPAFYSGYTHIEAAYAQALISIGDRTEVNNNTFMKSEGAGISSPATASSARSWRSSTPTSTTCTRTAATAAPSRWRRS